MYSQHFRSGSHLILLCWHVYVLTSVLSLLCLGKPLLLMQWACYVVITGVLLCRVCMLPLLLTAGANLCRSTGCFHAICSNGYVQNAVVPFVLWFLFKAQQHKSLRHQV